MLRKTGFFVGQLALLVSRADGHGIIIILNARVRSLALATSRCAKGIELGGELCLGFDEGSSVIPHRLIAGIGVLCEYGEAGRDQDHEEQDKGKHCVVDEEDDAHDTGDDRL